MSQISEDSILSSDKSGTKELRTVKWYVYEQYEIRGGPGERYVQAPPAFLDDSGHLNPWRWEYEPLIEHEDLFLILARWPEDYEMDSGDELDTDTNAKAAREWAETYGVLGLTLHEVPGWHSRWPNPAGGEGDAVAGFAAEAWAARRVLRLYEAASRSEPAGVEVETIAALAPNTSLRKVLERFPDKAREFALSKVVNEIHDRSPYYQPVLYWETNDRFLTRRFAEGWGFTNLLGAIWLQALWLLSAGPGNVKQCEYPKCNRIIAYTQPVKPSSQKKGERKKYKTYKNKRFCNNTCAKRNRRMKQRLERPASTR